MKKSDKDKILATLKTQYDEKFWEGMKARTEKFWEGMKARMEMSYFKYGDLKDAYPHKMDAIRSLHQRLDKYTETGNTEFLMDAANFAMIEFMLPRHPRAHFEATDSDQSPGRTTIYGNVHAQANIEKHTYQREGD